MHFQYYDNNVMMGYKADATNDADTYSDCDVFWKSSEDCFGIIVSIEKEPIAWFSLQENMVQIDSVEHRGCKSCGYTTNTSSKSETPFRIPCPGIHLYEKPVRISGVTHHSLCSQ